MGHAPENEMSPSPILFPRILLGFIVFICAEVFSGASVHVGLWSPWTWLVTFWLYFGHFFLFASLAVRTGRTSFWSLYLWGVLFGLYESWITKVIWHGYGGDGEFALGALGPYGYGEISMVFFFHPLISFILPLAIGCLLCPQLRRIFPDLAWFSGRTRGARAVQVWLVISFSSILAMNSGGIVNLGLNWAIALSILLILYRLSNQDLASTDGLDILVFKNRGMAGLGVYLGSLYLITYFLLNPAGLPSPIIQLLTLSFYSVPILGLMHHRAREPLPPGTGHVEPREKGLMKLLFLLIIVGSLAFSNIVQIVYVPVLANMIFWTPAGFLLLTISIIRV